VNFNKTPCRYCERHKKIKSKHYCTNENGKIGIFDTDGSPILFKLEGIMGCDKWKKK
jgi:hypothetical protein